MASRKRKHWSVGKTEMRDDGLYFFYTRKFKDRSKTKWGTETWQISS